MFFNSKNNLQVHSIVFRINDFSCKSENGSKLHHLATIVPSKNITICLVVNAFEKKAVQICVQYIK